jgi:hypothetical protein
MAREQEVPEWTPALRLQAIALSQLFPSIPLLAINNFLTGAHQHSGSISLVDDAETLFTQLATVELEKLKAYG